TKSPIIPMFIKRLPIDKSRGIFDKHRERHVIVIEPPINLVEDENDQQMALETNVGRLTKVIESTVRQNPHEWGGWMHERWKTKYSPPSEKLQVN
ncbi:hypothetical protein MNBD_BACTEROID05-256, partial [hydrothermal vent metagenome]